jgi:hypothetical protein
MCIYTYIYYCLSTPVHISDESDIAYATAEAITTLAHLAFADVLNTAKSSFSVAAGYISNNCVVYVPTNHQPLSGWIIMPEDRDDYQGAIMALSKELPACLKKRGILI